MIKNAIYIQVLPTSRPERDFNCDRVYGPYLHHVPNGTLIDDHHVSFRHFSNIFFASSREIVRPSSEDLIANSIFSNTSRW